MLNKFFSYEEDRSFEEGVHSGRSAVSDNYGSSYYHLLLFRRTVSQTYTKVRLKFDIPIPFYFLVLRRVTMERGDIAYTLQINVKKKLSKFCFAIK